jgi:prevent-host-death family protein
MAEVIHISDLEAAKDFAGLLARVREGAEVVIESEGKPVAVVRPPAKPAGRLLSEAIKIAEANETGVTLDKDFSKDLEEIIASHSEPFNPPEWD